MALKVVAMQKTAREQYKSEFAHVIKRLSVKKQVISGRFIEVGIIKQALASIYFTVWMRIIEWYRKKGLSNGWWVNLTYYFCKQFFFMSTSMKHSANFFLLNSTWRLVFLVLKSFKIELIF